MTEGPLGETERTGDAEPGAPGWQEEEVPQDSDPFTQALPSQSHSACSPGGFSFQLPHPTSPLNLKEGKRDFQAAKLG